VLNTALIASGSTETSDQFRNRNILSSKHHLFSHQSQDPFTSKSRTC